MSRCSGASQIVNFIDFQVERKRNVVPNLFKVRFTQEVGDVRLLAGEKIIDANHVMLFGNESFAEMRTEKTCAASYKNAFEF